VWRTDGQRPRQRPSDGVIQEVVELRRRGFRYIVLADDNFYPVTLQDLELAKRQEGRPRLAQLEAVREERFELMARLAADIITMGRSDLPHRIFDPRRHAL